MDFFKTTDWLNRSEPYAFKWDHLLFVFLGLGLGILLAILLMKKSRRTVNIWLISLWATGTGIELVYYLTKYILCIANPSEFTFNLEKMLPLHSCLMFMYVFPFAMFSKNKIIKTMALNFLVIVNMIMGFITLFVGCPPKGYSALSFDGVQSMVIHVIIVIVPLIMLLTKFYEIKIQDLKWGLLLFGILATTVWIFDAITGCDYFYIYDGHTFGILYEISENVPHIVWTLIIVSCYVITACVMHFSIVGIKYLISKKLSERKAFIKTKRLVLRRPKIEDAEWMFKNWASDPEVPKYMTWITHESIEVSKMIVGKWLEDEKDDKTERFVITLKGSDESYGSIDIVHFEEDGNPEIGYCLSRSLWNKGYMTEACRAFIEYLFNRGYQKVYISAMVDNIGSNRVIEKCGFKFVEKIYQEHISSMKPEPVYLNTYVIEK